MAFQIMYPPQKDSPSTFLLGDITGTDTLVTVANAIILPLTLPYPLTIGFDRTFTETVMVTAQNLDNNQLTVTRGSPAYAWAAGSKVARVLTAEDFKRVQDNIVELKTGVDAHEEAINGEDGLWDQITNLGDVINDPDTGLISGLANEIAERQDADLEEYTRATAVETALDTQKVNKSELPQVITDWVYSADETELLVTITRYNASSQTTSQFTKTIPLVSFEDVGIMTPEAYTEITNLRSDVTALQNIGGRFIGVSFATKAALDSYIVPTNVNVGDFTYVLDDETKSGATTRYMREVGAWAFTFVIDYDPVGIANATTAGIVKSDGGATGGKVFVETDGTMSVVGWNSMQTSLASKADTSYVDTAVAAKADTSYVTTAIALKADTSYVTTELNKKVNLTGGTMTGTLIAGGALTITTAQTRNIIASTTDLTAGTSALTTGQIYVVYE